MKKLFFLLFVMIVAASCSSVKVSSDFDKTAGFGSYKTYAFTPETMNMPLDDLNKNRILTAVSNELAAKGFTKSEKSDVLINVSIKTEKQQTATATNSGGYGYGRYGYGGGFSTTTINYDTYTDGTMFIEMIDVTKNQLVWQGRGTKTLDENANAKKREENLNYAIKLIFATYPPKI